MAKKQFNFRQTLKKKVETGNELPQKVALPKLQKDPEAVKQQVAELHGEAAPKKDTPKRATPKKDTPRKKAAPVRPAKQVRITIDMPGDLHKTMKIKAITEGMTIRRYILRMIEKDLKQE